VVVVAVSKWFVNSRRPLIAVDYEVLGLEVVKPLFLQVSFLHDQCSWIGAFVGAACRSLTRAQRVFERSEWRLTSGADEGTGAFVGELRGSGLARCISTEVKDG
jgi:hypothetical protein